jgi:K+/H+ antiporter YhaU regulatory subunit KhtT
MFTLSPDILTTSGYSFPNAYAAHWYTIERSLLPGFNLREIDFYNRFGVTVASIRREDKVFPYPGPEFILCHVDQLYLVGPSDKLTTIAQEYQIDEVYLRTYE